MNNVEICSVLIWSWNDNDWSIWVNNIDFLFDRFPFPVWPTGSWRRFSRQFPLIANLKNKIVKFWETGKNFFCCWTLVLVSWQASCSSLGMKLVFISQPSSKSTLPLARLQHMQQCQVGWNIPLSLFAAGFWSTWMVSKTWSSQWGVWTHDLSAVSLLP